MRAYTRDGLRVGALTNRADAWWAPAFKSRSCAMCAVTPDLAVDPDGFVDAVLGVVEQTSANLVMPMQDGSLQALRARRSELERRVVLPLASESALDIAVSKARTLGLAAELGIPIPRSLRVTDFSELAAALREVGLPAVIKPEQSWVERDGSGVRLSSTAISTLEEAQRNLNWILSNGGQALIQQWLPGRREAVSVFYARQRFWARMAQMSHREWPVLGGVSVLCETIPLLPEIHQPAERLIEAMDLEGCAMVEFRRDVEGRPVLMEVNPRIGGSVGLALAAGVNFPRLVYDWKVRQHLTEVGGYTVGRRLRWLPGDIWNLKSVFDQQGGPDVPRRSQAARQFVLDFLRPTNTLDVVDLHDMQPAISEMNRFVMRHVKRRAHKQLGAMQWLNILERVK